MTTRSRAWWIPALGVALVLAVASGAIPVTWYASVLRHEPRVVPPAIEGVERRPIVSTVWSSGEMSDSLAALDLRPDLLVRYRRLDWSEGWWSSLWKSGTLDYALDAQVFGGAAEGGCDLVFEGDLHASFRGLCPPDQAREDLTQALQQHITAEVRARVGL